MKIMVSACLLGQKCKYNGGGHTIGYVIDEEQYFQIDPLTAPLVLEAYKMYDKGATMKEICDWISDCSYACPGSDMCNMRGPAANGIIKWLNMEAEEDGEKNSMGAGHD